MIAELSCPNCHHWKDAHDVACTIPECPCRVSFASSTGQPLDLESRVVLLERAIEQLMAGELPTPLRARVARLERPVESRDAIAWEIGHAAALRGDTIDQNPFRKSH
jgi:hypothetical protein